MDKIKNSKVVQLKVSGSIEGLDRVLHTLQKTYELLTISRVKPNFDEGFHCYACFLLGDSVD